MNRLGLRNECELRIRDPRNALASDEQINLWINQAIKEIARHTYWPFLRVRTTEILPEGESTIELPEECRAVTKVGVNYSGTAWQELTPVPDRFMQHNMEDDTATSRRGIPYSYTDGGFEQTSMSTPPVRVLRVYPAADREYTLRITYLRRGSELTADTHYPPFPPEFDEAIIRWVMRMYWRQVDATVNAQMADSDFYHEIEELRRNYSDETIERFPRIMEDWDSYESITDSLNYY